MSRLRYLTLIILVILVISTMHPQPASSQAPYAVDRAGGAKNRITVVLEADGAPGPGGLVTLTLSATPMIEAPDLQVQWVVPPGAQLNGPAVESLGPVGANQTVVSQRQVIFPTAGTYKLAAVAGYSPAPSLQLSASGVLFFTVASSGAAVSDRDPDARSPMHSQMATTVTAGPASALVTPRAPNDDPCFTVQGRIMRIERTANTGGYNADIQVPVRNAVVDIRESDLIFDDSYGEVLTDSNGNYSKSFCDDDGLFDDTLEIYVRLRAELRVGGRMVVEVEDSSWIDEVYEYDSATVSSGGGTLVFDMDLNVVQSSVFNIADAIFDAWTFWNDSGGDPDGDSIFDYEAEVHWEPGYGDSSYYNSFWDEITVGDDPSDPDEWDDSVIIHEFGHQVDDKYSCDDNPGGKHFVDQLVSDPELAWGEGYPDYWQSAVRLGTGHPSANFYLDMNGAGTPGISLNLETWDVVNPTLVSVLSEFAIAAALWDLNDNVNDGQDQVSYGHAPLQSLYLGSAFEDEAYGFFDDTCDFNTYMKAWVSDDRPTDANTAAAILQNTGYTLSPASALALGVQSSPQTAAAAPAQYRWWEKLTYVVDNSASMTGPKFEGVKTVLHETVNDLSGLPQGTEFALEVFNNNSSASPVFAGQFFPNSLTPAINALSPSGAPDPNCPVYALDNLIRAIGGQDGGATWLFTDGDNQLNSNYTVEAVKQVLNQRGVQASVALLGLCPVVQASTEDDAIQPHAVLPIKLAGAARSYLGLSADPTPGGLVPYLLTAINSGGQFLYVDPSQVGDAGDILRAQITNSAGAGRWSDYVSDQATYRYDRLATWENTWIEAASGAGTSWGKPTAGGMTIPLPGPFSYYNDAFSTMHVYEDGYLTFGNHLGDSSANTTLPNPAMPNNVLYPLWDDLLPLIIICRAMENAPEDCGDPDGGVYTIQDGDWLAVQWDKYHTSSDLANLNTFQVQLNLATGEIRYVYNLMGAGSGSATIGLENATGTDAVQVSYNDVNGGDTERGYKFTPAPPQPSKTYSVTVDSLMSGVGFLLTGYSGSFEPLAISDPNGGTIACADSGVLCLNLGLVQYVQVNVNGRWGDWHAVVDAGPTGSGTFSFISMAASPLQVQTGGDHSLPSAGGPVQVSLGQPVDGNTLSGWFVRPNGQPFGPAFTLFDDGNHNDGKAGDGLFAVDDYVPPSDGVGYLWVQGVLDGVDFVRSDPVPYNFQPLRVRSLGDGINMGGTTTLEFELYNSDSVEHCYLGDLLLPDGWVAPLLPTIPCLAPGETSIYPVDIYLDAINMSNNLPSGTNGVVTLSLTEWELGQITDSASATITRHRPAASIDIFNPHPVVRPNGDSATLEFRVFDSQGFPVADGTEVSLSATLGSMSPTTAVTQKGGFLATFTSGPATGMATITALATGGATATAQIEIRVPQARTISLTSSKSQIAPDGMSTALLTVTVLDPWGDPVANQPVRIGVEDDDGSLGSLQGGVEVIQGVTDANGQFVVMLTSGLEAGVLGVRGELLVPEGAGFKVTADDRKEILISFLTNYLPLMVRH